MGISCSNWDGTLSPTEFFASATTLSDKWKTTSPLFPPWTWVSCTRPFGVTSHEVTGYLSLEKFPRLISIEEDSGDEISGEEEPMCSIDDATLVHSYDRDLHFYDLHIVLISSYRVPVLYIRGYRCGEMGDAEFLRYHGMQQFDQAMHHLEEKYGFMTSKHQYISRKDEGDRVIVFERGDLIFVFNFHWTTSYSDYRVGCLKPGKYKVVLDSDDKLFGGFNRIDPDADYFSVEGFFDNRPHSFMLYTPCRTAVVYALVD